MIFLLLEEHRRVELAGAGSSKAREELERNFAKAVRSSLDAITIADLDSGRYVEANGTFLQLTGYERNEVIGHTSLELGLWDSPQRDAFVAALRKAGSLQNFEVEIRKRDGSTATLISSAELLDVQGKPHALSMAKDITDRKRAQQEIQALNERLISAHEEERMRIARELHDDLSQQIAALSISASNLKQRLSGEKAEAREQVESLRLKLVQLAESVRHLSHQLHPAMLEYAGLAATLRSYCAEFSSLSGVNVSFHASEAFDHLSPTMALCIYRVTQEALQNVAKHALAKDAEVWLTGSNGLVSLTVSDRGAGCSRNRAGASRGLGLISMQERAKLVKGTFEFRSEPNRGTTVRVRIPMSEGVNK
jgi:PAS domain S-box-containing protein